jgi:ATP-dependent helicase/nuclease subunit A
MRDVAAITFTEKAAGEMRERLARGLDRLRALARGEGDGPLDESREADRAYRHLTREACVDDRTLAGRALDAMADLDHGTVSTIHRFCADLLRAFPFEAGVDPGFAVDTGEAFQSLCEAEWRSFVERELGAGGKRGETWRRVVEHLDLEHVEVAARGLADFDVPQALLRERRRITARELFAGEAARLAGEIEDLLRRQTGMPDKGQRYFDGMLACLDALRTEGAPALVKRMRSLPDLERWLDARPSGKEMKKLGGVSPQEVDRLARGSRDLVKPLLDVDDALIRDVVDLSAPFAIAFRETYLRRGWVGFNGLLSLTRDLLRDRQDVRRQLKRRFAMLLVDEFQDTDPLQYEIVLFLAEDPDESSTDAYAAPLLPGRLFIVGDPKQSVYRFRGADFAAYRRAVERVVAAGGAELHLTGNFRSVPGILGPVNRLFLDPAGSWRPSAYQTEYIAIDPVRERRGGEPAVELWTVDLEKANAGERRDGEGRVIAHEIGEWVREGRCKYEDVTILFRAFTNITHYLRPLREAGVPFVVDGGRDFLKRPEVAQLMATLRALSRPADQPSLLAFLRSPAGGVSDARLWEYARDGGRWTWRHAVDAGRFPEVARAFGILESLDEETKHLPVDAVVRRVLERTRLLPLGAAAFEGPQRVANMQKLAAAAGELARDGKLSLEEIVEALEEGRLEDIETDRPLADDAAEAVRITSIHRMKGLENRIVVLPDFARLPMRGEREPDPVKTVVLPDGRTSLALWLGQNRDRKLDASRAWLVGEEERHEEAEEVRVLYVATTRAREKLVVVTGQSHGRAPWVEALAPWGYDVEAPPESGERLCGGEIVYRSFDLPARPRLSQARIPEQATQAVQRYEEAREALSRAAVRPIAPPSGLHEERDERLAAGGGWLPRAVRDADLGKAAGIVLHRLLEGWDGADVRQLRERLGPLCRETARETRVDAQALKKEAGAILSAFLATDLPARYAAVERVGREVPVLFRDESRQVYRGSIDLLYRDGAAYVVADYKTDRDEDESALRARYTAQLGVYAGAVREGLGLASMPRAELWLLRSGRVVALEGPPDEAPPAPGDARQLRLW